MYCMVHMPTTTTSNTTTITSSTINNKPSTFALDACSRHRLAIMGLLADHAAVLCFPMQSSIFLDGCIALKILLRLNVLRDIGPGPWRCVCVLCVWGRVRKIGQGCAQTRGHTLSVHATPDGGCKHSRWRLQAPAQQHAHTRRTFDVHYGNGQHRKENKDKTPHKKPSTDPYPPGVCLHVKPLQHRSTQALAKRGALAGRFCLGPWIHKRIAPSI